MGPHHTASHPSSIKDQAGLLSQCLQPLRREALWGCPTPFLPWRSPSGPCCQIRALVMHVYPDGIKAYGHERLTNPVGRRGKPIKKMRFIPAERAHAPCSQAAGAIWHHRVGALRL